jgi:hypothetical protein
LLKSALPAIRLADQRGDEDGEEEQREAVVAQRLHGFTSPMTVKNAMPTMITAR